MLLPANKNHKTGISCTDRQWHWVSLLIENKSIKLIIDQREALSINLNQPVRLSNAPLTLGGIESNRAMGYLGAIDELQISRPAAGGEKDAILHVYRFDAVSGDLVKDDLQPGIDGRISMRKNTVFLDEVQDAAYSSSGILGDLKIDEEGNRPALDVVAVSMLPSLDKSTYERLSLSGAWLMKDCEHFEITADYADYRNQRNKGIAANWHKPDCDWSDWYQVTVPTSVQSALIKLGKLPDPFWNSNTYDEITQYGEPKKLPWPQRRTRIEGSDWWFARKFDVPKNWVGKRLQLYFDGIDYAASVYLNGKSLGYLELTVHSAGQKDENRTGSITTPFGIRTIEMRPLAISAPERDYRWQFVINGQSMFIKGANWCWSDPVVIDKQISQVVKRLRNHPSLVMWGGGNENAIIPGNDEGLFLTGKRCRQFDPSRPFHRTDPWGGSKHNWDVWHLGTPMDKGYNKKPGGFYGEYGFPTMTGYSSSLKYLPKETLDIWPPDPNNGGVKIHMCMFNTKDLLNNMRYCDYGPIKSWENFTEYSQIAQGDWLMYSAEGQRVGSGENKSGFWFYKLTELFPGYSWGVIDFYGTPKLAYYRAK